MQLILETREVGRVTVVRCSGRIVSGEENDALMRHIEWLLHDRRSIVLQMDEVAFLDSSGLGTMVRSLTAARKKGGDIKLSQLPPHVRKVLEITQLTRMFATHDSEEDAIAAFYRNQIPAEAGRQGGAASILCVDGNRDVLALLRELLRHAGYDVESSTSLPDALVLMRSKRYRLVVAGVDLRGTPAMHEKFQQACAQVTLLALDKDFGLQDAGEAGNALLERIQTTLKSSATAK
jgi:anti-sigma B factor antagonist